MKTQEIFIKNYDFHEIELKLLFHYGIDYFKYICEILEPICFLHRKKSKVYLDHYYDTETFKLYQDNYSYRIRQNLENTKIHCNFKYPPIYNKNGLITRREVKCEIPIKNDMLSNFDEYLL